jgi:hypothetical protein
MKKFFLVAGLASFAALGGCSSTGSLSSTVSAFELAVQNDANVVCGFIPTVATIASLVPAAGAIVADAASIAQAACDAIKAAPPVAVASARLKSIKHGGQLGAAVNVATVMMPQANGTSVPVAISGKFTR